MSSARVTNSDPVTNSDLRWSNANPPNSALPLNLARPLNHAPPLNRGRPWSSADPPNNARPWSSSVPTSSNVSRRRRNGLRLSSSVARRSRRSHRGRQRHHRRLHRDRPHRRHLSRGRQRHRRPHRDRLRRHNNGQSSTRRNILRPATRSMITITVDHDPRAYRFTAKVDGSQAQLDYTLTGSVMTITHTRVPPAIGGRGIAAELMRAALSAARGAGWSVNPACSYAAAYLANHPLGSDKQHMEDLLDEALDESFPASDSPSVGGSS